MTKIALLLALIATSLVPSPPAAAAGKLTRTFVSSAGSDNNPCTIAQPCATFATAYAAVAANGIVAALDPGKYGPLTITGPVTINGNGWAAITGPAAGNAITVNASSNNADGVILKGLELDGAGAAYNGIVFNSGGSLTVANCSVQNFVTTGSPPTGSGILIQPTSRTVNFAITDTVVSNNALVGIYYSPQSGSPSGSGVIDHVTATNNAIAGIIVTTAFASGATLVAAITNTIASSNAITDGGGITVGAAAGSSATVSIDNVTAIGDGIGISAVGPATLLLSRSVVSGNITGIENDTTSNTFYSYGNNQINSNGTDITSPLNMTFMPR